MKIHKFGLSEQEIIELEKQGTQFNKKQKKENKFLFKNQRISLDQISELEKIICSVIPAELKTFLMNNNGGKPNKYILWEEKVINCFYGFYNNAKIDYSIEYQLEMYKDRFPNTMLPIASAGGGDLILIGIEGEYLSKIYYWNHNFESEYDHYQNITFITDNLNSFLDLLKDDDEINV